MTSEEFADEVTEVIKNLRGRILGPGHEQYDMDGTQAIESKSNNRIISETLEELDDAIVYLAHLRSRINKIGR